MCTTSYGHQRDFNKIPLIYFGAEYIDVHLHKFFFIHVAI